MSRTKQPIAIKMLNRAINTLGSLTSPMLTKVKGLLTMIPALRKPRKDTNKPRPTAIPSFKSSGIASIITLRAGVKLKIKYRQPERKIANSASCQSNEIPPPSKIALKKPFIDMPGANIIGYLANAPIMNVAIAADSAVAVKTEPLSIPSMLPKIAGFTAKI